MDNAAYWQDRIDKDLVKASGDYINKAAIIRQDDQAVLATCGDFDLPTKELREIISILDRTPRFEALAGEDLMIDGEKYDWQRTGNPPHITCQNTGNQGVTIYRTNKTLIVAHANELDAAHGNRVRHVPVRNLAQHLRSLGW